MKKSPNFDGKKFINPVETSKDWKFFPVLKSWLFGKEDRKPERELPFHKLDSSTFDVDFKQGLRIIWMGHSSVLVEIEGCRILIDPVWSERCSPSNLIGPKRFHPVPISLKKLPKLDAVLISHDHYDHLEKAAVTELSKSGVHFFMPLGVGAHFEKWNIKVSQLTEMDWWDVVRLKDGILKIVATPARHFSGRNPFRGSDSTFWVSWVIIGIKHRVFFSGDTGYFSGLKEIGDKFGPFDFTLIKIGAYGKYWPDMHLNPEETVVAHQDLRGRILLPIHWGTYNLAFHNWYDPPERLIKALQNKDLKCVIPIPGQIVSVDDLPEIDFWWRKYMKH